MIEFIGVSKSFDGFKALSDINVKLPSNSFVSLLGPSGCGKTTLLRLLAGFIQPDRGSLVVDGREISNDRSALAPEKRNMGMVFQTFAVWPHMTVYENVAFGLRLRKLKGPEIQKRTDDALALVKLEALRNRYPSQLSGGQQQRVAIARSIVVHPKILLLDEPLSSLDAKLRHSMLLELRELQSTLGIGFVYVTHDQTEALMASDQVVVLHQGVVQQCGTPRELYESPATRFVAEFLGDSSMIEGNCVGVQGGNATVEIGPDIRIFCKAGSVVPGTRVVVCVRPDAGTIATDDGIHENEVPARVLDCRYGGTFQRVKLGLGSSLISVTVDPSISFNQENIRLRLDPDRCIAFPLEPQQ